MPRARRYANRAHLMMVAIQAMKRANYVWDSSKRSAIDRARVSIHTCGCAESFGRDDSYRQSTLCVWRGELCCVSQEWARVKRTAAILMGKTPRREGKHSGDWRRTRFANATPSRARTISSTIGAAPAIALS